MRIEKQLKKQGFCLDTEMTEMEAPAEIWINKRDGLGVYLRWFKV